MQKQSATQSRKSLKLVAAATLTLAAAFGAMSAQAEKYQGVHPGGSMMSRDAVNVGASEAARDGNLYSDAASAGPSVEGALTASRAAVRSEAVAIAREGNPYGEAATEGPDVETLAAAQFEGARATLN